MGNTLRKFWNNCYKFFFGTSHSRESVKNKTEKHFNLNKANYNIAVVGKASTGRKTLIEAIIGNDGRTTRYYDDVYKCETRKLPNLTFWKMPRFVQTASDIAEYYNENCLFLFDLLLVVSQPTLGEDELMLINQAEKISSSKRIKQPVILVRSCCDADIHNQHKRKAINNVDQEAADAFVFNMTKKVEAALASAHVPGIKIFFVSAVAIGDIIYQEAPELAFQEKELLNFLQTASKNHKNAAHHFEI